MNIKGKVTLGLLAVFTMAAQSCGVKVADADYPAQKIYLPAAAQSQIYLIDKAEESSGETPTEGTPYRFLIDYDEYIFSVPLSVYRSGVDCRGDVNVDIYMDDDVVYDLMISGEIDDDMEIIPSDLRDCVEMTVIPDGRSVAMFNVSIDLDYLMDSRHRGTRLVFGVSIGTDDRELNEDCSRLAVIIDTSIFDNI